MIDRVSFRQPPSRRIVRAAVLAVGLLLAVWLTVRNALLPALIERAPALAAALPPASGEALSAGSGVLGLDLRGLPGPEMMRQLALALDSAPLLAEPFFAKALQRQKVGDYPAAVRLMEEARRRSPRMVNARLFLAVEYLRAGRIDKGIGEIDAVYRLGPATRSRLTEAMLLLADDPRGRAAVDRALAADPIWRRDFIAYASNHRPSSAAAFDALRKSAGAAGGGRVDEQSTFLGTLIQKGDYRRAYLAWINFLPPAMLGRVAAVYDGDFRGFAGPAPFNWSLENDQLATAEMIKTTALPQGGALDVDYFGGDRAIVAQQTLTLAPGSYAIGVTAVGHSDSSFGGSFAWSITCLPAGNEVLAAAIEAPSAPRRSLANFTIPENACGAQTLSLIGVPGDVASLLEGTFSGVAIVRRP